jgi:hypothetical protein
MMLVPHIDNKPVTQRELLVLAQVWLDMAQWSRSSVNPASNDPRDIAELGRASGLESAAHDILEMLGMYR